MAREISGTEFKIPSLLQIRQADSEFLRRQFVVAAAATPDAK
jgi:hypothetical protein